MKCSYCSAKGLTERDYHSKRCKECQKALGNVFHPGPKVIETTDENLVIKCQEAQKQSASDGATSVPSISPQPISPIQEQCHIVCKFTSNLEHKIELELDTEGSPCQMILTTWQGGSLKWTKRHEVKEELEDLILLFQKALARINTRKVCEK